QNGNLHVEIPIYTVHQRAMRDATFNFVYDISSWNVDQATTSGTTTSWTVSKTPHQFVGWHLLSSVLGISHMDHDSITKTCYFQTGTDGNGNPVYSTRSYTVDANFTITDNHGTVHPFQFRRVHHSPGERCTDENGDQIGSAAALDGSGIILTVG